MNAPACLCNDRTRSGIGLGEGLICAHEGKQAHVVCERCVGPGLTCPLHKRGTVGRAPWLRKLVRTCPDGCVLAPNETTGSHRCTRPDILFLDTPTSKLDIQMACDFNTGFVKVTSSVAGPILDGRNGFNLSHMALARAGQVPVAIAVKMTQGLVWGKTPIEFIRVGVAWPQTKKITFWPPLVVDDAVMIRGMPFSISDICHVPFSKTSTDSSRAAFGVSGYEFGIVSRHPCARKRWAWMGPEELTAEARAAARPAPTAFTTQYARSRQPKVFGETVHINAPAAYSTALPGAPVVRCECCGKMDTFAAFLSHGCGAGSRRVKSLATE